MTGQIAELKRTLMSDAPPAQAPAATENDNFNGQWRDRYWWSNDGVRLQCRDYPAPHGAESLVPVFCMPGLTRNARDFEGLAEHLAKNRRVIAIDFRGRGESGYAKDPMSYVPLTYAQDVLGLCAELGIDRFVSCGTSLGGIVTMLLAAMAGDKLAGAVLNDVGPVIEAEGIERIRGYVGQAGSQPTWVHAARAAQDMHGAYFPGWKLDDWLRMVKRTHKLTKEGRIVPDYDSKIAEPFRVPGGEAGVDLWPALAALGDRPTLILRGRLSDILSAATAEEMVARLGQAQLVTLDMVGHAPSLDEAEAQAAIDALLADVDQREKARATGAAPA